MLNASQDEVADLIVEAIRNSGIAGTPLNFGNGEVFLGRQVTNVDVSGSPTLLKTGAAGLQTQNAVGVVFSPLDDATTIANAISTAINGSGLGITTTANQGIVTLPANASFSPNGTQLTPSGVHSVTFKTTDSPATVATNIENAIRAAFAAPSLTANLFLEPNDTLAAAIDSGITGGAANFQASGLIGDNAALNFRRGSDVDLVKLELNAGDHVQFSVTTPFTSRLTPALRLFDAQGRELASTRPTPFVQQSAFGFFFLPTIPTFALPQTQIDFNVVTSGTYYVAVSSNCQLRLQSELRGKCRC